MSTVNAEVNAKMTTLADEIRTLSGTDEKIGLDDMATHISEANDEVDSQVELLAQAVAALEGKASGGNGVDVSGVTATPSDVLEGKVYVDSNGEEQTGTIPSVVQATPTISIATNGLITASATQSEGFVSGGTKSGTKQLTVQSAKTITPSTTSQTAVAKNVYTTGVVTVAPIPSNYEDVVTETTEYTSLNDELEDVINSLPAAGGGESDGASVEICTVTVVSNGVGSNIRSGLYYVKADDGEPTAYYDFYVKNDSCVIPYVVKGSLIVFSESTGVANVTNDGGTVLRTHANGTICFISTTAPDNVTITLNSAT